MIACPNTTPVTVQWTGRGKVAMAAPLWFIYNQLKTAYPDVTAGFFKPKIS